MSGPTPAKTRPASETRAPEPAVRRLEKSAAAFRTISEVSSELDVPQHVLRFWETKFPQVRPLKRGGGRRYYRPEDVDLLRGIRHLLYADGYTIKGVQRLMREGALRDRGGADAAAEAASDPAVDPSAAPAPKEPRASTASRRELEAVLDELIALRDQLRRALG